jgi:dienelactone hydrolase
MRYVVRLAACLVLGLNAFNPASAQAPNAATQPPTPATAPTNAAPVQTPGVEGGSNAVYTTRIPPEQMITLDANGDKFQARHIADLSGIPRGAVIILHDSGQHPSWPFTTEALIDDLPLHGWDTLSIELPPPAVDTHSSETPKQASTAPASTTPTPAEAKPAATTAPTTGIEPQTQARISAAIKYFSDQANRNIALIGFGSGAIRAAETVRLIAAANTATPGDTSPITALVMIAPQQQLSGIEMDLPKLLPLTGISTLDMTLDNEPPARADAEARRRAVLHQRTRTYTRLELPPINNTSDAQHSAMVKRVRAWIQKNANEVKR